jgi:uncharacterized membrane protein YeaQ/YmgE (transglycosylase-associated protein family)
VRQRTDGTTSRAYRPRQINGRGRHINFIISLLIGGLLGWVVSRFTGSNERQAIIPKVVVGMVGVVLGRWMLGVLLESSTINQSEFGLSGLLVSLLGAMVLLTAVQLYDGIEGRAA